MMLIYPLEHSTILSLVEVRLGKTFLQLTVPYGFADDHSIRKSFIADSRDQEHQLISMLMDTVTAIASHMATMHLKLNPD